MHNEQTNAHVIDSLLYCALFMAPTRFNANASSPGSSHLVVTKTARTCLCKQMLYCPTNALKYVKPLNC